MKLVFKDAKNEKLGGFPGADGSSQTLEIRALLTRTLAGQFRCGHMCFTEKGVPQRFKAIVLSESIKNAEVVIGQDTWTLNEARGFRIGPPKEKASATDVSLEIRMVLHFDGKVPLSEWFHTQNKDTYELVIKPPKEWNAQGELFTEVEEPTCISCANEIPLMEGDPTTHMTGQACTKAQAEEAAASTLPPAVLAGGTHQRKRRGAEATN